MTNCIMIHIISNFIYYPNSAIRVYTTVVFNTMKINAWSRFLSPSNFIYRNAFIIKTNRANSKFNTSHTILAVKLKEDYMLTSFWLSYLNSTLLFIVYPGISNPGPQSHIKVTHNKNKSISVFYQNVQGLIPFGNLTEPHPNLDNTKIYELHAYIQAKTQGYTLRVWRAIILLMRAKRFGPSCVKNNPDVIILNETWLKPSILSTEILPSNYNVFRLDRSLQSHPTDPLNPKQVLELRAPFPGRQ